MDITVQEAIQELITALIRSLGSSHGKLLTLMRTCPPGAESLALRVLTIFTEHGRASTQLVALVKALINERDLDARFLIPIIAEMDKVSPNGSINWIRTLILQLSPAGHHATLASDCVHPQWPNGTEESGSLGIQLCRDDTSTNLR